MIYDVAVIGGGPAGLACGIWLARHNKSCIIFEKKSQLKGKVCGDGLSNHCMWVLDKMGIDTEDLLKLGGKKVERNITSAFGRIEQRYYAAKQGYKGVAVGLSRDVFDGYLKKIALDEGCTIRMGHEVKKADSVCGYYVIDNMYEARELVFACGAVGGGSFGIEIPKDVPAGISARVYGDCNLASDAFYFKYDNKFGNGYAWLFPVGEKLWNYGVWSGDKKKDIKKLFKEVENRLFGTYFSSCSYERMPKGAIIGATRGESRKMKSNCIGDCGYVASYESGEGISFAIENGIRRAEAIIRKKEISEFIKIPEYGFKNDIKVININQVMV